MIEAAIVALLLGSPSVTSLVGSRIKKQGTVQASPYPHLMWALISDRDLSSSNLGRGTMWEARIQIDSWGTTVLEACTLAGAVLPILAPRREPGDPHTDLFVMPGCTVHNGRVALRTSETVLDLPVPNQPAAHPERVMTDFVFQYTQL